MAAESLAREALDEAGGDVGVVIEILETAREQLTAGGL